MTSTENSVYFPVFITEFLLTLIINIITVTAFTRIRYLRKRSTYLIINLTVADLLVGTVTGPLHLYHRIEENFGFTWPGVILFTFHYAFPVASQVNLCLISLDRLHATLFPFRHCLIRKCFYFKVIVSDWSIAFLLAALIASLRLKDSPMFSYVWASFSNLTLLLLVVSYIIIIVNVQRSPHSQNRGSINTERKLSITLFIVTTVSILTILPWAIHDSIPEDIKKKWRNYESSAEMYEVLDVVYYANSIMNPLVYAVRLKEFEKAIRNLVS
ncbi:trace amine-associated receptor 7e-like [Oculina patagonica]